MPRLRWACAAALLALAGGVSPAVAQTVQVRAGTTAQAQVAAGDKVAVPVAIDLSAAGGRTLAQLLAGITWGTNRLTYDSLRVTSAAGLSVVTDVSAAASGTLSVQASWGTPLAGAATLLTLYFTAGPPSGGARIALAPTGATDGAAADIISLVRPEAHEVCVAFPARWGDVNGFGGVNIIDAQQIARWATGLAVTNAALVVRRGDVNALNGVNIVDAQQVARWATGLTVTAPRINTILLEYPTANNIVVSPTSASVTEGAVSTVVATVRDSVNNSLAGCYPVTWSTSNAAAATVSSAGNVTAVAPGSATITATSGSLSAAATITVGQRATTLTAMSALTQDGTAGAAVATRPSVKVTDVRGDPVAGVTVTFAVGSGGGSVGTATATTGVDGIATLDSWTLGTTVGSNTLTVTAAGLSGSPITFTATALAGAASQLVLTTQPAGAVSGVALSTQPVVEVRDQYGNRVTTSSAAITATKASGGGTLSGTATVNAVNGVATFSGLTLSGPGSHTLTFGTGSLEVTSSAFTVTQEAASLALTTQPAGAVSGAAFTAQPVVEIRDNAGLPVTTGSGATLAVSVVIASGTGTLGGTASATATSGVATFAGLTIAQAGAFTLQFTTASPALSVTSSSFTVTAGAAASIALTGVPVTSRSGLAFTPGPVVATVRDGANNPVAGASVAVSLTGSGSLLGTTSGTTDTSGRVTFTGLGITSTTLGSRSLTFAVGGGGPSATESTTLKGGVATQLAVTTQPSASATNGTVFGTQPVAQLRDASGNATDTAATTVTVALVETGGVLGGTLTAGTDGTGAAAFSGLKLTGTAGTYTLAFSAPGLTGTSSSTITLGAGSASTLAITIEPSASATSGVPFTQQPVIQLQDASGRNAVAQAGVTVTAAKASGSGTLAGALTAVTDATGAATFSTLQLNGSGSHTLTFTSGSLTAATSQTITVSQVAASLVVTTQPAGAVSGAAFTTQPVVEIRDDAGLRVTTGSGATLAVTAAFGSGSGTLQGTKTVTAVAGLATFTDLSIVESGSYTLQFTTASPALTVTSASLSVAAGAAAAITANSATSQSAPVGAAVSAPPSVKVTDASGNPVSGVSVAFAVTAGGGSLAPPTAVTTGSDGLATLTSWTLGTTAGTNTVTATATGLSGSPVSFGATGTQTTLTVGGSFTANDKPYDGTVAATGTTAGLTLVGVASGDTVTIGAVTLAFATAGAGAGQTVALTGLTLGGAQAYRYLVSLAGAPTATATISPASQTLSFGAAPSVVVGGTGAVSATATSGLPVSFTSQTTAVCTIDGTTVTGATAGTCTIQGTQAGNGNYAAAPAVTQSFAVGKGSSTVTVTGDTLYTYSGSAQGPATANVTGATGAVTYRYAGRGSTTYGASATRPTNAGEYTATATVAADANYEEATSAAYDFRIEPAAQAALGLTVTPTSVAVGGTAALSTTGGSGTGAVSYAVTTGSSACSITGSTLTALAAGSCQVTATKAADQNHLEATSSAATGTVFGTASALAVSREPAGAVSGAAFTTQPLVEIRDAGGRLVTSSTLSVTAAIASGTGTLSGTVSVNAVAGVATFTDLAITGGGAHTLTFTATGLTAATSASVTVSLPAGATISRVSTAALSGYTGNFLANAPAVRVLTSGGAPIPGVAVSWSADAGSLVERSSGVTDATGTAALLGWRLGTSVGTQTASATVTGQTPVGFAATVTAPPASQFNIEVRYLGTPPSAARQAVFTAAATRWAELIVGDLSGILLDSLPADPDGCYPFLDETVDDLLIFVTLDSLDGPGNILGGANPCLIRGSNGLPVVGQMVFDLEDIPALETDGQFDEVILHEMGHVLGLGALWPFAPHNLLQGGGGADPYFTGATGRAAFIAATGITGFLGNIVPVEATGGAGTRDSHWRETVFNTELMTGFLDAGSNPLSAVSVASLRDMGYAVNDAAADAFAIGSGLVMPGAPRRQLRELPSTSPIRVVDPSGRTVRSILPR